MNTYKPALFRTANEDSVHGLLWLPVGLLYLLLLVVLVPCLVCVAAVEWIAQKCWCFGRLQ